MSERGEGKHDDHGDFLAQIGSPGWVVDVSDEPVVHGQVPLAPVFSQVPSVPPVVVETAV